MLDYIVVGFGISGLSVTRSLSNRKLSFVLYNNSSQNASLAAGGLVNPLMLKTGKPVWNVDEFLPHAKSFYSSFNQEYFSSLPIHRVFFSVEDQNNHVSQFQNSLTSLYTKYAILEAYPNINAPYKMSEALGGGVIQIQRLLQNELYKLKQQNKIFTETFNHDLLVFHKNHIEYKGTKARNIIFCEGYGICLNPFFKQLPIEGNKGEYLLFKSRELQLNAILKNKYFLIPLGNDVYKYGATYNRNDFSKLPSQEAREEMLVHLDQLISCSYEIIDQIAGIRPTVKDKKPIYGTHPIYKNMHILNGMGSRGLMMAPLLAEELLRHIEQGEPLRKEVDVKRFIAT